MWVEGAQTLVPSSGFPCREVGSEVEQLGQKATPMWDAGITGGSITCHTTMPAAYSQPFNELCHIKYCM